MAQNKKAEALSAIDKAAPLANNTEVFSLVDMLIKADEASKALSIAKENVKTNNGAWPANYTLAKAYSANKDYKNAIKSIEKSLGVASDRFKNRLNGELEKLKKGESIN